jgi:predicted transcriptional regulator
MASPLAGKEAEIADLSLQGLDQYHIAKHFGVTPMAISKRLRTDAICKAILEQAQREIVVKCVHKVVSNYQQLLASDKESIRLKATDSVSKIVGIQPSHTQTTFIQQLFIQQNNYSTPTQIQDTARLLGIQDVDVLDVDNPEVSAGTE